MEISEKAFTEIYSLSRTGGLLQGLVHNLNAPLQNLGMDMDMIALTLEQKKEPDPGLIQELKKRLSRMEEEFDKLNRLIRLTASRSEPEQDPLPVAALRDFLEDELEFLRANLYFKHYVETSLELNEPLTGTVSLPKGTCSALGGLLHALVDEMEKLCMQKLIVQTKAGAALELSIEVREAALPKGFISALELSARPGDNPPPLDKSNTAAIHAGLLLKAAGIALEARSDHCLRLNIPCQS
ncbi:MAG: hypothetical protein ACLFUP_01330 [Desulfobacteraceae bacterium]